MTWLPLLAASQSPRKILLMLRETLINEPIVASVLVDCGGLDRPNALAVGTAPPYRDAHPLATCEFDEIAAALEQLCDGGHHQNFDVFGREHRVLYSGRSDKCTFWKSFKNGGGEAQIVLASLLEPTQRITLRYRLTKAAGRNGQMGWLQAAWNPTTILRGNNIHPATIVDPDNASDRPYPSSDLKVMKQIFRLGFDLLEDLAQRVSGRPLFRPQTAKAIKLGAIRVLCAQWACYFPTPDVSEFLQIIGVMYGQTIGQGRRLISVADHLGLSSEYYSRRDVTGVLLVKSHGDKPVYSPCFYNKQIRIADVRQGKTLSDAERRTIEQNVRFDMTAHSEGILAIVRAARRRLGELNGRGISPAWKWLNRFRNAEAKSEVWWLEHAVFVLSHRIYRGELQRRSFSRWLVPEMITKTMRLDVLAGFTRKNLRRLLATDDNVAIAWRGEEPAYCGSWAKRLAKKAHCSNQTVYTRRDAWLEEFGIDISAPYALYRDLLYFGPHSLTRPESRSALLAAVAKRNGVDAIFYLNDAAKTFDRQRREIVGHTIAAPLHEMQVTQADKPAHTTGLDGKSAQKSPAKFAPNNPPAMFAEPSMTAPIASLTVSRRPTVSQRALAAIVPPLTDSRRPSSTRPQ